MKTRVGVVLRVFAVSAVVLLAACAVPPQGGAPSGTPGKKSGFTIGVSVYSLTDTYGAALLAGVRAEAQKSGDTVTLATDGQFDPEKQGHDVQDIIAAKPDALLLAAGDTAQARTWVDQATAAGVPVFGLFNAIDHFGNPLYQGVVGAVQINEVQAGAAAAKIATDTVPPGSTVGVILGKAGVAEVADRLTGFTQALAAKGRYTVVSSENGEWTPQHGTEACEALISAHPDLKLIYNESDAMSVGCVKANNIGGVKVVGNGGSGEGIGLVQSGTILGTTCFNPVAIATQTMQMAHDDLDGSHPLAGVLVQRDPLPVTAANVADCPKQW